MRNRLRVIAFFVLLLTAACWFSWRSKDNSGTANERKEPSRQIVAPMPPVTITPMPTPPGPPSEQRTKEEVMSEKLSGLNDQPINFYGKLLDQHGSPVVGAKIRAGVMVETRWMGGHFVDYYTSTDISGNFAFNDLRGARMIIQPSKEGYEFKADINRNFNYSKLNRDDERHHPDPSKPEVFTMWKKQGAEPLISGDKFLGITADGTPFTIDLVKGRKTKGRGTEGDLVVSISQPHQISVGQKFDWSFNIEATTGGLSEATNALYLNEAPMEGYAPKISREVKASDLEWSESIRKTFFLKSRNGSQFARVSIEIRANYQGAGVVAINYLVNPSGSRNLEYDPAKVIKVH